MLCHMTGPDEPATRELPRDIAAAIGGAAGGLAAGMRSGNVGAPGSERSAPGNVIEVTLAQVY